MVASVADADSNENAGGCCGGCRTTHQDRPRFVIGVFTDLQDAKDVAARLHSATGQQANVLSEANGDDAGTGEPPVTACSRLYQQIKRHLSLGATVLIVDAEGPEQQLGMSRLLLQSKCDMLLTHDGPRHAD
jgi:hypothetical protein